MAQLPFNDDGLAANSDDPAWRALIAGSAPSAVVLGDGCTPEDYAAVFGSPAGRKVLADMARRYVFMTIVEPGQSAEVHGIRQGQANVVFDIHAKIGQVRAGDS